MSRQMTSDQMQLAQMQLQYEVAKLQNQSQEMTAFGSVCGGLSSNPIKMTEKLIDSLEPWDTFIQVERDIDVSYWED